MKKWIWIGLPLIVLASLVGWRFAQRGQADAATSTGGPSGGARRMAPVVELASAKGQTLVSEIQTVGTAESPYRIEISPKVAGRIDYLVAREGDRVRRGQVLARIDPSEIQAQVLQQQASVAEARSRLAQAQLGAQPAEVGVQSQLQQQTAGLASARADYNQVQQNYEAQVASADAAVTEAQARVRSADAQVGNAEAEIARRQASLRNAQTRLARVETLLQKGFIAAQEVDDVRTQVDVQSREVDVARGQLTAAQAAVSSAQAQLASARNQASIARRRGRADIAAAQARVAQARAGLSVASANRAQTPAYRQNLAALSASVRAAEAQLAQARARLGETVLRSPIEGVVTARQGDPGAMASPGQALLTVQHLDWLFVTASLPIEQSERIYTGQQAALRFDALPNRSFVGRIAGVNPSADVQSRQFGFRVRLDNPGHLVKPGMFGRVTLTTDRVVAEVVVPREAVKTDRDGGSTVTVVDEELTADVREVRTGATDGRVIQILSGVRPGERVVTLSYQSVRDEQKVRLPGGARRGQGGAEGAPGRSGAGPSGASQGGGRRLRQGQAGS